MNTSKHFYNCSGSKYPKPSHKHKRSLQKELKESAFIKTL